MPLNTFICASIEQKHTSVLEKHLHWRNPIPCAGNLNEPALHQYSYSPGTINLRSSAFICGLFFAGAPDSKDADRIYRMDRINPSTNPVNPVHPVQSDSSFSAALDISCTSFIKIGLLQNSSPQSHHIPPSCASGRNEPVRRLIAFHTISAPSLNRCAYLLHVHQPKFNAFVGRKRLHKE